MYSGTLEKGEKLWNPRRGVEERAGRIYRMHSNKKVAIDSASSCDAEHIREKEESQFRTSDAAGRSSIVTWLPESFV